MNLFCFGLGYSALALIEAGRHRFDPAAGTVRSKDKAAALAPRGISGLVLPDESEAVARALGSAQAVLVSVPPDAAGDPVLRGFEAALSAAPRIGWIGYLSSIGVYGDSEGAWVDEATPIRPDSLRARRRAEAEQAWLAFGERSGRPVQVFRLAGIYGPGRNALRNLREGTARRVVKPGQVFNRIHVEDIAAALLASIERPRAGAVYNLADDEPAPPQDVVACAAALMGVAPPPEIPFDPSAMSAMAASFYGASRRAANGLVKRELGLSWRYPTYREGLAALHEAGEGHEGRS